MTTFGWNRQFLQKDGRPWLPVMGEFHFSRYRAQDWERELRKMRVGGVEIVSTYVIWIHHEEIRGEFDFTGCRDLRRFLLAAQRAGLYVFVRPGPWAHAEARNGGFPDWLADPGSGIRARTDDPAYLACVRAFWEQIAAQCRGLLLKDGGPVIGLQIENEYGHAGGLTGPEGLAHMRTLTALAGELGFTVPYVTATGWGGALTGGLLPVMGAYCDAPWAGTAKELPANANFVFTHRRNDGLIACDHRAGQELSFDEGGFPYLTAELGGGLQVTAHRRPVATGRDTGAMALVKLGSGANLLGFYMYHGGSNPAGKRTTLQESRATGYANDLPEINYDFNAPIRQFGTISDSYRELRLLALFLADFGSDLAPLPAGMDPGQDPEDCHTLRLSWRHDQNHGYLFVNNYQRLRTMAAHLGVTLTGRCDAPVEFPPIDIRPGEFFFLPYRMALGGAVLHSALATPLCRLDGGAEPVFVFYGDRAPQFSWETTAQAALLHLTRAEALQAAKIRLDRDYLVLAEDFVWEEDGELKVCGGAETVIRVFPTLPAPPRGFAEEGADGPFTRYRRSHAPAVVSVRLQRRSGAENCAVYDLCIDYPPRRPGQDWLLRLDWLGERMELFDGPRKINDWFYTGQSALLRLGYFDFPTRLTAVVRPLREEDRERIYLEHWPQRLGAEILRAGTTEENRE